MTLVELIRGYAEGTPFADKIGLPPNVDDWPQQWRESYEERLAIMLYHGGLDEEQAKQLAEESTRNTYEFKKSKKGLDKKE